MVKKVTKKKTKDSSQEFEEKAKIMQMQTEMYKMQHEFKMEELKYSRESDKLHHEREMERQRIKSAEIQRTIARREQSRRYN